MLRIGFAREAGRVFVLLALLPVVLPWLGIARFVYSDKEERVIVPRLAFVGALFVLCAFFSLRYLDLHAIELVN